jgi:hypothetical protein
MTELKTLKDLIIEDHNPNNTNVNEIALISELKSEAVKWVKAIGKGCKYKSDSPWSNPEMAIWIIHFFNITEADLQEKK